MPIFNKSEMIRFHGFLGYRGPNKVNKFMSKSTVMIWGQCQDHSAVTALSSALALIASNSSLYLVPYQVSLG